MSWSETLRARRRKSAEARPWQPEEAAVLASAVNHSPSVHNTQPWSLELQGRSATLRQRRDVELSQHDPSGRDLRISCGAALVNLELAVRSTGTAAHVALGGDDLDVVGTVVANGQLWPTPVERQRFGAIVRRMSYRRPFEDHPLAHITREALEGAARETTLPVRWITGPREALALARLLVYAGRVYQNDVPYQRELAMWLSHEPDSDSSSPRFPRAALGSEGVGAMGLASGGTRIPDEGVLADRIEQESVLVIGTPDDGPDDHLRAGDSMQRTWLEATRLGLVASVMTQPLHLSEVRRELAEALGLPGVPQALMRFGYPSSIPVPRGGGRDLPELFGDESEQP
jgi:nitroreductase